MWKRRPAGLRFGGRLDSELSAELFQSLGLLASKEMPSFLGLATKSAGCFEELVSHGHVYILETPLFRVRNKKETRYCYSEAERDEALEEISSPEVTRFKGLGEINPSEFKQFIRSDDMRLVPVTVTSMSEVENALEFFMGRNTPKRKQFIVDNLITDLV